LHDANGSKQETRPKKDARSVGALGTTVVGTGGATINSYHDKQERCEKGLFVATIATATHEMMKRGEKIL
jgi:hypothetical protein